MERRTTVSLGSSLDACVSIATRVVPMKPEASTCSGVRLTQPPRDGTRHLAQHLCGKVECLALRLQKTNQYAGTPSCCPAIAVAVLHHVCWAGPREVRLSVTLEERTECHESSGGKLRRLRLIVLIVYETPGNIGKEGIWGRTDMLKLRSPRGLQI